MADLFPKTPLPCIHVWRFMRSENEFDDYFECQNCHKQMPYEPEELADMEMEMDHD